MGLKGDIIGSQYELSYMRPKTLIGGGIAEELFGFEDIDVDGILEQFLEPHLFDLAMKEN